MNRNWLRGPGVVTLVLFAIGISAPNALAEDHAPYVLDGTEGERIEFPPHETRSLARAKTNQAGLSLFEIVIPARSAGAPPHTHRHEDEFFYVRTGSVTFLTNGARKTVASGGFALLPRDSLHALWNASDEEAILLVGTSEGKFDDYFDAVAIEVRQRAASTPQAIGEIMDRLGQERGIEIRMDALPADVAGLYGM